MRTVNQIVGQNVLALLEQRNLTQTDLGQVLGVPRQTIHKMIHEQRMITAPEMVAIADFFKIRVEELFQSTTLVAEPLSALMDKVKTEAAKEGIKILSQIMELIDYHRGLLNAEASLAQAREE